MLPVTAIKGLYSRGILCDLEEEFRFYFILFILPLYGQQLLWCQTVEIFDDSIPKADFLEDDDKTLNCFHPIQIY